MPLFDGVLMASNYATAAFGLAGSLIGGAIAGTVSLLVARQTREAAEGAWVRDSRREIYDRFLTGAQTLLIACGLEPSQEAKAVVEAAHTEFFGVYGVVQTVAEIRVVDAARVYAYRLLELEAVCLGQNRAWGARAPDLVSELVRTARHDAIDAMRSDLGLTGSARPPERFNPFLSTEFEEPYAKRHDLEETAESPAGRPDVLA